MYLHLGKNVVEHESNIIGIFDLDNTTKSRITREYLSRAEKSDRVTSLCDDLPRSFIVLGKQRKVLVSQLSPQTILRRIEATKGIIL
ncbi:MAG: DUF370 domain-containing protein [Oscillospiraceae bacterium]|nr:DUF370 domain-containing protein [Oscillospiraceae bacterium]